MEEKAMVELKTMFIARALELIKENGEINDFVEFAKEQAIKDGMDRDEFMDFLDSLKVEDEEESDFNWIKLCKILSDNKYNYKAFKGDNSIIIENKRLNDLECLEYCDSNIAPINLKKLNELLKGCNVKLEFIEALNLPFDCDGHINFIRFKVITIE